MQLFFLNGAISFSPKKIGWFLVFLLMVHHTVLCQDSNRPVHVFTLDTPDYTHSPYTGMTRKHWIDAAKYMLEGAFGYIHDTNDAMKFPKQKGKSYPNKEEQIPTEKLEGLCRTLYIAAPLLKENPGLVLNNIKVADYYRQQLVNIISPGHPS